MAIKCSLWNTITLIPLPPHKIWNIGNDKDNTHNIWRLRGESYQELFDWLLWKPVPETAPKLNVFNKLLTLINTAAEPESHQWLQANHIFYPFGVTISP
jgi:hypothetical protein